MNMTELYTFVSRKNKSGILYVTDFSHFVEIILALHFDC